MSVRDTALGCLGGKAYVKKVHTVVKGGRKHSLTRLQSRREEFDFFMEKKPSQLEQKIYHRRSSGGYQRPGSHKKSGGRRP